MSGRIEIYWQNVNASPPMIELNVAAYAGQGQEKSGDYVLRLDAERARRLATHLLFWAEKIDGGIAPEDKTP